MTNPKTILLIGRSGRGKSTLANVVTDTNDFKESSSSVSETKEIQLGRFEENSVDYQIIDTPGIGDTKMSDNEVLDIIAKAVYLARDGVSQVFFTTDGRFDQYEMATYDLLRTIIFDENITKHTTIVRTRFPDFRKPNKCKEDIDSMAKETQDKKPGMTENISAEEKELSATSLAEIVKSCQGRIVHVDNPTIPLIKREDKRKQIKLRISKEKRSDSRKILLEHLSKNCQETSYKPEKLTQLSNDIAEDYFQYLNKKAELQKELEEEMKRLNSRASQSVQSSLSQNSINIPINQTELVAEEKQHVIIPTQELIAQLQDKKERLEKEIAEKEKTIRQKVLKHIFNNYNEISKELGGNIFLDSVIGEHNWQEINSEFANRELVVKWLSQGFDYFQTQRWATALGNDFNPHVDAGFCAWLRDIKKLAVDKVERRSYPCNDVEQLRQEYAVYLKKETELLSKHNEQLPGEKSNAQEWLDKNYPREQRSEIKELNLAYKNLKDHLSLNDFVSLEKLVCDRNQLTFLDISGNPALKTLSCYGNQLTFLDISGNPALTELDCSDNPYLVNLNYQQNNKLKELYISNTGLDHSSIINFYCSTDDKKPASKVKVITQKLSKYISERVKSASQAKELKTQIQQVDSLHSILSNKSN